MALLSSLLACTKDPKSVDQCNNNQITLRQCPAKSGKIFLPRTYTANSLYLGYSSDSNHFTFITQLLDALDKYENPPLINILVPRQEILAAHELFGELQKTKKYKNIQFHPSVSNETMWMQDYFELSTDLATGIASYLDLPYLEREGELIPASLSLTCNKPLIKEPEYTNPDLLPGNGDYGGNIEPFSEKLVFVGNNMTPETLKQVHDNTTLQEVISLNVEWLDTGHVDELFAMLPHKKDATACEQTLIYASPAKAIELLKTVDVTKINKVPSFAPEYEDEDEWPDFFPCLAKKGGKTCKSFYQANEVYQQLIQAELGKILEAFQKNHKCKPATVPFPQLFSPLETKGPYGSYNDRAIAFNENGVNNIFIWPNLFLPGQTIKVFQDYTNEQLRKLPYDIHYTDSQFAHTLLGGIHCASSVSYACSPQI